MNAALIPVSQSSINSQAVQTVNARDLHSFLGINKDFSNWIKDQIQRARLKENQDFIVFAEKGENLKGGRPSLEYHLTIEAGKHIGMMSGSDKGFEVRDYFIECERQAKQLALPADPFLAQIEMVKQVYINQQELKKVQAAQQEEIHQISHRIEDLTPQNKSSEYFHKVTRLISHVAKLYAQTQRNNQVHISHAEAQTYINCLVNEKFDKVDVAYIKETKELWKFLNNLARRYEHENTVWFNEKSIFARR